MSSSWEERGRHSSWEAVVKQVRDEEGLAAGCGREVNTCESHLEVELMELGGLLDVGDEKVGGVKMTLRSFTLVIRGAII